MTVSVIGRSKKDEKRTILDTYINVISSISPLLSDIAFGVTDQSQWLAYFPGRKVDLEPS